MIAVVIIGLISGLGIAFYNNKIDDKNLRTAAVRFESLSTSGHSKAFFQQKAYRLNFISENEIALEAVGESESSETSFQKIDSLVLDNITISVRRWGAKEENWLSPKKQNSPIMLSFTRTGLCEPISVRFTENENWMILHLDPLTAQVRETESHIE